MTKTDTPYGRRAALFGLAAATVYCAMIFGTLHKRAERERSVFELIQDGRWQLPPHPVEWNILPQFERPLAVRGDTGGATSVLLMARTSDCFAIGMPYETEAHYSAYLSLFGRDLPPGKLVVARTRIQVLDSPSESAMVDCYKTFERRAVAEPR